MSAVSIEDEAGRLRAYSLAALRSSWRTRFGEQAPAYRSRDLLVRAYLHRVQAEQFGDVRPTLKRRMAQLAAKFAADPAYDPTPRQVATVGSALVREWNGVRHVVLVTSQGFQYGEVKYASLTQVAKVISGTHQSGPRFFGVSS